MQASMARLRYVAVKSLFRIGLLLIGFAEVASSSKRRIQISKFYEFARIST